MKQFVFALTVKFIEFNGISVFYLNILVLHHLKLVIQSQFNIFLLVISTGYTIGIYTYIGTISEPVSYEKFVFYSTNTYS
jgi:hypothetical protein